MSQEILWVSFKTKYVSKLCLMMQKALCLFMSLSFDFEAYAAEYCTYLSTVWKSCKSTGTRCNNMSTFECRRKAQACCWLSYFFVSFMYSLECRLLHGFFPAPIKLLSEPPRFYPPQSTRLGQCAAAFSILLCYYLKLKFSDVAFSIMHLVCNLKPELERGFSYARPSFSSGEEVIH